MHESSRILHACLTQAPGFAKRPSPTPGAFKDKQKPKIDRCAVDFRLFFVFESGVSTLGKRRPGTNTQFGVNIHTILLDLVVFFDSFLVAALLHVEVAARLVEAY